jgi:hypothetical protein
MSEDHDDDRRRQAKAKLAQTPEDQDGAVEIQTRGWLGAAGQANR